MTIDFVMSYPCFIAMVSDKKVWTVAAGGDKAIVIHTDYDLLNAFYERQGQSGTLHRLTCERVETLIALLQRVAANKETPISHVIIDPTDLTKYARTYPLPAFIRHLEAA